MSTRRGVRYRQESFAAHIRQTRSLVSFVQLTADATSSSDFVRVKLTPSARGLALSEDGALVRDDNTYLVASDGAQYEGSAVTYEVPPGTSATVYAAWLVEPGRSKRFRPRRGRRTPARETTSSTSGRTSSAAGATYEVPERVVQDAQRSLLIQNLTLGWRYSIGDRYHTKLSTPEAIDAAGVMGEYGFHGARPRDPRRLVLARLGPTTNWKIGEQLLGAARVLRALPRPRVRREPNAELAQVRRAHAAAARASRRWLLRAERYSADVDRKVYGLHTQAVVWQGLRAMAVGLGATGHRCSRPGRARRDEARGGLRRGASGGRREDFRTARSSFRSGSSTASGRTARLTASRLGATGTSSCRTHSRRGFCRRGAARRRACSGTCSRHGSRLLGLVRADAYTLYGHARFPRSGTDQVYGLNMARFLADNDRPDLLVLSLYGQLAAGMTAGTHVAGEAATVAPVRGEYYRRMFLPPNSGSNSAFLETLRLLLVHETRGPGGVPHGLELAYATPRSWLQPGKQIAVTDAPTSFGRLSYSLSSTDGLVQGTVEVPSSPRPAAVRLRVRLPAGKHLKSVLLDGRPTRRFDPVTGTINLSGRTRHRHHRSALLRLSRGRRRAAPRAAASPRRPPPQAEAPRAPPTARAGCGR